MKREREKHIELPKAWVEVYHRERYRTAIVYLEKDSDGNIVVNKLFYQIVTKITYLTSSLWLQYRNERVKGNKQFIELPDKPNWLVMTKNFRRDQDRKMKKYIQ